MNKRIAFFAHYDPDGIIAEYVVSYVSRLLEAGIDSVYFCSDSCLATSEQLKLPSRTKVVGASRHGEYDFGSWKRCFAAFRQEQGSVGFSNLGELVLCNDSCYGPLFSLNGMFDAMHSRPCDYWGITHVEYSGGYFPSFFLVMRNRVLADPDFYGFFQNVGTFDDKREYCERYEVGLNRWLDQRGYVGACHLDRYSHLCHSSALAMSQEVFVAGMPFIRVMTARSNPGGIARMGEKIRIICGHYGYNVELIRSHLARTAPGYEKFWRYRYADFERTWLGILRVRQKPNPEKDTVRLKIKLLGLTVFYCTYPMKYVALDDHSSSRYEFPQRRG